MARAWVLLTLIALALPAWADLIPRAAQAHQRTLIRSAHAFWGLSAPLAVFAGQVHQESRWQVLARSPVGAEGLAQFMPATRDWMITVYPQALGVPAFGAGLAPADTSYHPAWALRALVLYDRWLYARQPEVEPCQRWAMTLSAYNGGLGWVQRDRRLASASGADGLAWFDQVERFNAGRSPANFHENRTYVRLILTRWAPLYARAGWGETVCGEAL